MYSVIALLLKDLIKSSAEKYTCHLLDLILNQVKLAARYSLDRVLSFNIPQHADISISSIF